MIKAWQNAHPLDHLAFRVRRMSAAVIGTPLGIAYIPSTQTTKITRQPPMTKPQYLIPLLAMGTLILTGCEKAGDFPDQEALCSTDTQRESERLDSASNFPTPALNALLVNGAPLWQTGDTQAPSLSAGDIVTLQGNGFGAGPDIDFSKIMIGNTRILETDLIMYEQKLDIADQVNFETSKPHSQWNKNIVGWSDNEITFRVPEHTRNGELIVQVQKRTGNLASLLRPGETHNVIDAQTARITDKTFQHGCDVVSEVGESKATVPLLVNVNSSRMENLTEKGEAIFWGYDFNIGLAHKIRHLDWKAIFNYQTKDPITGETADPHKLFGGYKTVSGEVPSVALNDYFFAPYPQKSPIPGFLTLTPQLSEGNTRNSGWAGYRYAESSNPYMGKGSWIGFNCASCHGYRITYEASPGETVSKVFPGLPNPLWTMKWSLLGNFEGIKTKEKGPAWTDGAAQNVDKTMLIYHMPQGAGEHNIVRAVGEGSETDNDYQFSPISIPSVTHYMAIRRSLSHTESYVGFEGSYIHSEEPDGAVGSMNKESLEALTAYMTTLDKDDNTLRNLGLYRWLKDNGQLAAQTGAATGEGEFLQQGWQHYPGVIAQVDAGKQTFDRDCGSCHKDNLGAHTNEAMIPLAEAGRFFTPTIYQKQTQSIRVNFLRDLYWVQHRGLLSDGHVRNLEDLVDPQRCSQGSALYNSYYTLHAPENTAKGGADHPEPYPAYQRRGDVFRVPKSASSSSDDTGAQRNRFIERHKYFVEVPWDSEYYYWDFQKMRSEYGPDELGSASPIGLAATPHGWCAQNPSDIKPLVQYLLTL